MKKERTLAPVTRCALNTGQLDWLPKNPREWTAEDVEKTRRSIVEDRDFLEDRPLLAVEHDGRLVVFAGNLRLTGVKKTDIKAVPVVVYTPESDEDLTTIKRRAMKDNGSFGKWDFDMLANEWDDLPLADWGIPAWENHVEYSESKPKETHDDDFDEGNDRINARCRAGDLWRLGRHRLLCADSTVADNYAILLQGKEARLCVTSPPYGVGKSYEEYGIIPWKKTIFGVIENITKHARIIVLNIGDLYATGTQFIEPTSMFSTQKMSECGFQMMYARIWKKQGGNFAGTNPYYTVSMKPVQEYEWILGYAKRDYEGDYAPIIVWMSEQAKIAKLDNKILKEITGAGFMYGHWFTGHQFSFIDEGNYNAIADYCRREGIDAFQKDYKSIRREFDNLNIFGKILPREEESDWGQWAIWNIPTVSHRTGDHPSEFPVELPARCIKMHSRPGDVILDPFCGAGTSIIASEQLGRNCYGIELDPHYCDIIIARWEKETGEKAQLISGAEKFPQN